MSDVTVEVAGRAYRLGCADGEEAHLRALAEAVDGEARRLSRQLQAAPEEGRLLLMVALVLADRLVELGASAEDGDARIAQAEAVASERAAALAAAEAQIAALEAETQAEPDVPGADDQIATLEAALSRAETAGAATEAALVEAEARAETSEAAAADAQSRISALEASVAAARSETAELRRALEEARETDLSPDEGARDLFGSDETDLRAQRIEQLASRIEHLTEQISLHLGTE